jgi:hypothetical protein
METYQATQKGPLIVPGYIDPNDAVTVQVYWGAPVFQASTVYRLGDVCRPTTDNGYYYECTINGETTATEPTTWAQTTQTSGTAKFTAVAYDLFVLPSESISTSTWAASDSVTIITPTNDTVSTTIMILAVPDGVASFTLTNHVTKSNGEKRDKSFKYKVREQ